MLGPRRHQSDVAPRQNGRLFLPTLYRKDPGTSGVRRDERVYGYEFHARHETFCVDNDGARFLLWERKGPGRTSPA